MIKMRDKKKTKAINKKYVDDRRQRTKQALEDAEKILESSNLKLNIVGDKLVISENEKGRKK